ncbi:MAG TPA: hypothetical protein VFL57_11490 [Bryobacteraceae bacterium]|nr:hypothetical protein [Bryobacteraceae bacterium]
MLKDLLQRGKCLVGFHQGPWLFSAEKICTKVQVCTVCNARTEKPEHNWTEWSLPPQDSCDFVRRCSRCDITETKTEHAWGEPEYAEAGACNLQRVCSRCAAAEAAGTRHVMDSWAYVGDGGCAQTNACSRCGATGTQRRTEHDWNAAAASAFYGASVRICRRCGDMRVPADSNVSMQQAASAVRAITTVNDSTSFESAFRQHSTVLTAPATQHYLKLGIDRFSLDSAARQKFEAAAKFTAVAASIGIEAALAYAKAGSASAGSPATAATATASPQPQPAASASSARAGSSDQRLIGHWRHTEHMGSGGFSMATDTHLVLGADGSALCWSHSAGSFGEQRSDKESGSWRTTGGMLYFDAGLSYSGQYQTDGASLVLPGSGRYRFWTKVR